MQKHINKIKNEAAMAHNAYDATAQQRAILRYISASAEALVLILEKLEKLETQQGNNNER